MLPCKERVEGSTPFRSTNIHAEAEQVWDNELKWL